MRRRPRGWMTCDTVGNTAGGGEMRQEETKEGRVESRSGRVFTNMQFYSFTPMMSMTQHYEGQKAATSVCEQSSSSLNACISEGSKMRDWTRQVTKTSVWEFVFYDQDTRKEAV